MSEVLLPLYQITQPTLLKQIALITAITGKYGSYLVEMLLKKITSFMVANTRLQALSLTIIYELHLLQGSIASFGNNEAIS